jgi:hypothetical protein
LNIGEKKEEFEVPISEKIDENIDTWRTILMRITYKRITKGEHIGKHSGTENGVWEQCGWVNERTCA